MEEALESIITGLCVFLSIYIKNVIKKRREEKKRVDIVSRVIENSSKVYPILWSFLSRFRAKRVAILQFHNGGKYYSGKSIDRLTMTHEVHDDRVPDVKDKFMGIMLDHYHNTLKILDRDDYCYYPSINEVKDESLENIMVYHETSSIMFVALKNKKGDMIGSVLLSFDGEDGMDKHEIEAVLLQSNKIRELLIKES